MDIRADTTNTHACRNKCHLEEFKGVLEKYHLVDIWRVQQQMEKNYSYYSNIHDSYHRIDYFFINHLGMSMTPSSDIGGFLWSDHAPLFLEIKVLERVKTKGNWRLNDNLLKDKECIEDISKTIKEFGEIHEKEETSLPMQWETLK